MASWFESALSAIDDVLFPNAFLCIRCEKFSHGGILCPDCEKVLERDIIPGETCVRCGHPLKDDGSCGFCHFFGERKITLKAPYLHKGLARELVHMLKYNNVGCAAQELSVKMAEMAISMDLPGNTVVTWVTMPKSRLKQRGIDHGRLLAEAVAARLGLPCRQLLSRENRKTLSTQQGQNREERQKNLHGLFQPICSAIDFPVLLVDDVATTGSTLITCFDALALAGMEKMYAVTATLAGEDRSGANFSDKYAPW